jgi:hypothetical protein
MHRTTLHYPKTHQNTDRIARTAVNVANCRTFHGRYYRELSTASGPLPTAAMNTARVQVCCLAGLLPSIQLCGRCGRYFVFPCQSMMLGGSSLCVYPSAGAMPMHLASDYIHPYKSAGDRPARFRVRVYLPDDVRAAPVVFVCFVPNNPGGR